MEPNMPSQTQVTLANLKYYIRSFGLAAHKDF